MSPVIVVLGAAAAIVLVLLVVVGGAIVETRAHNRRVQADVRAAQRRDDALRHLEAMANRARQSNGGHRG